MRYVCQVCGYVYDDAEQKVPFEELPDDWQCPLCGARKSEFLPEEAPAAAPEAAPAAPEPVDIPEKLTAGQMAAVLSNLARGCEKQYREDDARALRELSGYFASAVPEVEDATVARIASMLKEDVSAYPGLRSTADASSDRGAARICVWGEKVTRMISSLTERLVNEGPGFIEGTDVWVCTVCGFVWVGETPPELCPVCKVPAWKFEKIEGRDAR